jgi:hypothetical protein
MRTQRETLQMKVARPVTSLPRPRLFPLGVRRRGPDDRLGGEAARALLDDNEIPGRLTRAIAITPADKVGGLGRLEAAR